MVLPYEVLTNSEPIDLYEKVAFLIREGINTVPDIMVWTKASQAQVGSALSHLRYLGRLQAIGRKGIWVTYDVHY